MKRFSAFLFSLLVYVGGCSLLFPSSATSHPLKITTWNMDWLTSRSPDDTSLPSNIPHRTEDDFDRLNLYAQRLKSDIIAVQEVDDSAALRKVFPSSQYQLFLTSDPIPQHVGLVIRNGISVTINPEITALNTALPHALHQLRGGLDATFHFGTYSLRVLVVHLKTGCWARPIDEQKHSCPILSQQFHVLEDWILDRQDDGTPYLILGDFNRRLTLSDPLMKELNTDAPLTLATAGRTSPCRGGELFIDHILLGNAAQSWMIPDSLRVMTFRNASHREGLSDHCPVSLNLAIP